VRATWARARMRAEEAEAGDGLVGRAKAEEERRARRYRLEAVRRGLPEVDLVRRLGAMQEMREPTEVGIGDETRGGESARHRGHQVAVTQLEEHHEPQSRL